MALLDISPFILIFDCCLDVDVDVDEGNTDVDFDGKDVDNDDFGSFVLEVEVEVDGCCRGGCGGVVGRDCGTITTAVVVVEVNFLSVFD